MLVLLLLTAVVLALEASRPLYNFRYVEDAAILEECPRTFQGSIGRPGQLVDYVCCLGEKYNDTSEAEVEDEAALIRQSVEEIQKSFSTNHCVFGYQLNGDYWTYAYCFGDRVIQYHEIVPVEHRALHHKAGNPNYVYTLGRQGNYAPKGKVFINHAKGSEYHLNPADFRLSEYSGSIFSGDTKRLPMKQRVVTHLISDGEICDLTLDPRTVEVIYLCDPHNNRGQAEIVEVSEITTCHYQMIVNTPRLCAIPEFVPKYIYEDETVDVQCVRQGGVQPPKLGFPVSKDNKITVSDYSLAPIGNGFSFGHVKQEYEPETGNAYIDNRHILVFNGVYEDAETFKVSLGRVFWSGIENTLMAPEFDDGSNQRPLYWNDTFVIWSEVYDFTGEFLHLVRIARDSEPDQKVITVQIVDPDTFTDDEGDDVGAVEFARPHFQAPQDAWNFEKFHPEGRLEPSLEIFESELWLEATTITKTETITVPASADSSTTSLVQDEL